MTEVNSNEVSPELLRTGEAARRLGVSRTTLNRMIENKEITATWVRSEWRLSEQTITAYLNAHTQHAQLPNQPVGAS